MRSNSKSVLKVRQSLTVNDLGHLAQLVRASRSHREGHWFKSSNVHQVNKGLFREGRAFCF
jgi:hypothetical protein